MSGSGAAGSAVLEDQTDASLVARSRAGEHEAFALLLHRHRATATRVARRILRDPDEVADILQEATLAAYLNLRALRSPERFRGWFCGIVLNHCRMQRRRTRRNPAAHSLDGYDAVGAADVASSVQEQELLAEVVSATRTLPAAQRQAALLVYIDGLSLSEAATALGVSPGALKVRLHRARQALRAKFSPVPAGAMERQRRRRSNVVELEVLDVVLRRWVNEEGREAAHAVMVLKERGGSRLLPIWVGEPEATSIALELQAVQTARPLTYHFAANILEAAEVKVESVTVTKLVEEPFYASVAIQRGRTKAQVDARPSDAINLALRTGAPLFADEEVMKQAGKRVRLTKAERAGSAAIVEHLRERAPPKITKEELDHAQKAWQEYGLELLDEAEEE